MGTAVITNGDRTASRMLAGMTRLQFSGMDSYLSQSSPADCALTAAKMTWDFGDGASGFGYHVSHQYAAAGTYTVTLTVTFMDGSTATAQTTATINPLPIFANYFARYVSWANGNDSAPGDGTIAHPYKTIERAYHDWRSGGKLGTLNWGAIFLNKGETHTYAGLNDSTHDPSPDYGPLLITSYGLGSRPFVAIGNFDFQIIENHDASMDHGVQIDGVDWSWAAPSTHTFEITHRGCQISNSNVTNGCLIVNSNGGGHSAFFNFLNQGALHGPFVSNQWLAFDGFTSKGNGSNGQGVGPGPFDHQLYASSGCTYLGINNCVFDQTGAVAAYAGLKLSGARKVYVGNPTCIGNDAAFDVGSNSDDRNTQDVVYDAATISGINRFGWYANACDRITVRNPVILQGCSDSVLRFQSYSVGQQVTDFQFLQASAYKPIGQFVYKVTEPTTRVVIQNCAVQKAVASGAFIKSEPSVGFGGVTFDGNDYFRDSGQHGDAGFASVGGTDESFDAWVAAGQDAHSIYADPAFVSATDLHLQNSSPCIDKGLSLGVVLLDYFGNVRPAGLAYDIGCAESQIGGGFMTFRQYPADMDVVVTELGFESQAAAQAAVLAAIADNPICSLNNQAWVYPGTDDSQPNHIFVRRFTRWERGTTLWYIVCGQDDGTEAHETGIPGYAIAFGYDTTLQALMTKYATDVGDPTQAGKNSHYEVCWRKKQDKPAAPLGPPVNLNPIFSESTTDPPSPKVSGGQNTVQLTPIYSETDTNPVAPGGPPAGITPPPIWSESLVGTVTVFVVPTTNVQLLKIFSRSAVNDITATFSPSSGKISLLKIFSESNIVQLDYSTQGGNHGFNLAAIFSESDTLNPSTQYVGGGNSVGLGKIWSESNVVNPAIHVLGGTRNISLPRIFSESVTQPPQTNFGNGNHGIALDAIFSESATLNPSNLLSGNQRVPLLAVFSESDTVPLDFQVIYPNLVYLIAIASEAWVLPVTPTMISTPQAASVGDFSGGVQLNEEF